MPAMLDDPSAATIYRTSGASPFPDPHDVQPTLPEDVYPRQVTLRDRVTIATIVPFSSEHQVPHSLLMYLSDQLNKEIDNGDTYPMIETMSTAKFGSYWFQNFAAVMLLGNIEAPEDVLEGKDWSVEALGSFYIKPNYPGRSSHVCNAGFLVTDAARNRGVGRLMGESYLDWAPKLGYSYSVFNLVYETNVASCRIWDALGFKRIGRVKGAGSLRSYPGQLIDAIIFGRDLGPEGEDFVSEERFDKIKFYLKTGKYPAGADRAEKSRLRSAATHYKLLPDSDKLMLKDKEVISDPQKQYEIARNVHVLQHGGINKTTATIAEQYHWVRIKETVSLVIRNCTQCKELGKAPVVRADGVIRPAPRMSSSTSSGHGQGEDGVNTARHISSLNNDQVSSFPPPPPGQGSVSPQVLNRSLPQIGSHERLQTQHTAPIARMQSAPSTTNNMEEQYLPLDPQIMEDVRNHLGTGYHPPTHHHIQHQPPSNDNHRNQDISNSSHHHLQHNHHHGHHEEEEQDFHDPDSFQAMLSGNSTSDRRDEHGDVGGVGENEDLDMLIDDDEEEEEENGEADEGEGEGEVESGEERRRHGRAVDGVMVQLQAEAAARAAEEALRTVGRRYGSGGGGGNG